MIADALFTALHALGFMTLFGVVVAQHLLIRPDCPRRDRTTLWHLQWIYLGAWLFLLATGIVLGAVLMPPELYLRNGLFHLKLTLVVLLLPLWWVFGWELKRVAVGDPLPKRMAWELRFHLLVIAALPFLATFMARGYGYFGGS